MPEFIVIKHLPLTNPEHLFGRDEELVWLERCWAERAFVASISAWGGVGKTSLVTKWLCAMRDAGWPGAERVFVWSFYGQGMRTAGSSDGFFAAALKAFGDADPLLGSPWEKGERLGKLVREKRTLLVLDGVEPMQWGPGEQEGQFKDPALQTLVQDLAVNNSGLLLMTSRLPIRDAAGLSGEKVRSRELKHLSPEAGADLLRARKVQGTDEELRQASIEYDGHALALTLLGSYLEDVANGDIRRRNEIGSLLHDEREGGHARRVMASYEPLLGQTEREILRMLGLFDRPAAEDEIAALRAAPPVPGLTDSLVNVDGRVWNKAIAKLRRIGLIGANMGDDIDAHPLVRHHFGEQLENENIDAFREGHRRLYEFLQTNTKEFPETIAEMEPLYKAVVHGCLAGKYQEALEQVWDRRMRRGTAHFSLRTLGAFGHEVAIFAACFEPPWERLVSGLTDMAAAVILCEAGVTLREVGRLSDALVLLTRGRERRVALQDWTNAAITSSNLYELHLLRGDLRGAFDEALRQKEFADKFPGVRHLIVPCSLRGYVNYLMGLHAEAVAWFSRAEALQQVEQPEYPILYSIQGFYYCELLLQEHVDDVQRRALQTLQWHSERQRLFNVALDHLSLGRSYVALARRGINRDIDKAAKHIKQALDGLRSQHRLQFVPLGLLARAELYIHKREFPNARRDLDEAVTIATRCGFRLHECDAHLGYARLAVAEDNQAKAGEHLEKARKIVDETGYHRRDGEVEQIQQNIEKLPPEVKPTVQSNQPDVTSRPTMTKQNVERIDLGIIIALEEEFEQLVALSGPITPCDDHELTAYRFHRGSCSIVTTFVGDMGESRAVSVTERMIAQYHPQAIVIIGIAAGVHEDLCVGDVYVPPQAVQYLQDSKASLDKTNPNAFGIVPGAPACLPDHALLEAARHLKFRHAGVHHKFREACVKDIEALIPDAAARNRLITEKLIRQELHVRADGHLATGPVVGAAAAFSSWIRSHDRNVKALEMESAAVLRAAMARKIPLRALAIRGISDYGDDRKEALDKIGGGVFRKYAMRNAVRFLWALLDTNALPR